MDDNDRFEQLLHQAQPRLWRAFVGARGIDGADEAVAEAFAWAAGSPERLVAMENPIGYLYRVGLSRTVPRKRPMLPAADHFDFPDVEPGLIPALLELSEDQRVAVWLVHACGWSYAEVALALGISRSTVGSHVSRALGALRLKLEVAYHD